MLRIVPFLALLLGLFAAPTWAQETPCISGMAGIYTCQNVDLLARLPLNATPTFAESSSDLWGWTDPETGIEYAIVNQYDHTAFVDLSEPTAPFVVGRITAPSEAVARDAKVYADHVFIGTDSGLAPVQVFDLRRLRTVTTPPVEFQPDALYTNGTDPHNIALNEDSGFAYLVYTGSGICDNGLHILDVRTPTSPVFAGCFTYAGDEFHDLQCVNYDGPDSDYAGDEVCFGAGSGGGQLAIVDVTDKANPSLIAEAPYPNAAYTHQGWLTEDQRYFLLNDEFDEGSFALNTRTVVFDVSDLEEPAFVFAYTHPTTSTDHNLFVKGDYAYQANYTSGLRILDLTQIEAETLSEAAFFDTHPEDDETGFDGAFGVYPFFESGIVIVSDMARGLFVLRPTFDGALGAEPGIGANSAYTLATYPNPSLNSTTVALTAASQQHVTVVVHDVFGRPVHTLFEGQVPENRTVELQLEGSGLAAGTYLVRVLGETFSAARSVTFVR